MRDASLQSYGFFIKVTNKNVTDEKSDGIFWNKNKALLFAL